MICGLFEDRRETSEADRLFSLAERSATYAMSINNAGTDPEIKIEAIRYCNQLCILCHEHQ
jgi:hypothetical protein